MTDITPVAVRKVNAYIVCKNYYDPTGETLCVSTWWDGDGDIAVISDEFIAACRGGQIKIETSPSLGVGGRIVLQDPANIHTPLVVEIVDHDKRNELTLVKYVSGVKRYDTGPNLADLVTPKTVADAVVGELERRGYVAGERPIGELVDQIEAEQQRRGK